MQKTHWGPRYPVVDLARKKLNYDILSKSGLRELDDDDSEDQAQLEASSDSEEKVKEGTWVLLAHVNQAS